MRFYKLRITWWGGCAFPNKVIVQLELNEETSYLNSTITPDQKQQWRETGESHSHMIRQSWGTSQSQGQVGHLGKKGTGSMTPLTFTLKVTLLSRVLGREDIWFFGFFWGGVVLVFTFVCFKARVALSNLSPASPSWGKITGVQA